MLKARVRLLSSFQLCFLLGCIIGCDRLQVEENNEVAYALRTDGTWRQLYHRLAVASSIDYPMRGTSFLVAIEKAPRELIRSDDGVPDTPQFHAGAGWSAKERERFDGALNDGTAMFVSHIRAHTGQPEESEDLYNIYRADAGCAASDDDSIEGCYAAGWRALRERLQPRIENALDIALISGKPITHIIFMSVGWNNDQLQAVDNYNDWAENIASIADAHFNPLLIGISWPSVWGSKDWILLGNLFQGTSFYNKKSDSEEIGFTVANWLFNIMAADVKEKFPRTRIVALGHSFGVRLISYAVFSSEVLKNASNGSQQRSPIDLIVGLQPAVGADRFIADVNTEDKGLVDSEDAPFSDFRDFTQEGLAIVMTSPRQDRANLSAFWSEYIGGPSGLGRAEEAGSVFHILRPINHDASFDCNGELKENSKSKILIVDGSEVISGHSDVFDEEAARLIWSAISCFAPSLPPVQQKGS